MSNVTTVRLADKTARALEDLSRTTGRSKSYFIEKALKSYIAEYSDSQVALDRLRDKKDPVLLSAELRKGIGRRSG